MRLLSYKVPRNWNYFLFGDAHRGANLYHSKGFAKMINMINSNYDGIPAKHNFATDHGDTIEAITIDDPRFAMFDQRESTVLSQIEMTKKELWPIRKKLFAILNGNHERKLHGFGPIVHYLCKELGVSYGTTSAKITFTNNGKLQFKHFCTHGNGSISSIADDPERRKLNWRLALKRKLREKFGDCILNSMGHTHKIIISKPTETLYLTDNGKKLEHNFTGTHENLPYIHPDYKYYVNTGSFLRLYGDKILEDENVPIEQSKLGSGYAENANYDPIVLGFVVVKIRNNKIHDVVSEQL